MCRFLFLQHRKLKISHFLFGYCKSHEFLTPTLKTTSFPIKHCSKEWQQRQGMTNREGISSGYLTECVIFLFCGIHKMSKESQTTQQKFSVFRHFPHQELRDFHHIFQYSKFLLWNLGFFQRLTILWFCSEREVTMIKEIKLQYNQYLLHWQIICLLDCINPVQKARGKKHQWGSLQSSIPCFHEYLLQRT